MRRFFTSYKSPIFVGILGILLIPGVALCQSSSASSSASSQTTSNRDSNDTDTLFTEIHLGSDGVTAVGENGATYRYDFDADSFLVADLSTANDRGDEGGIRQDIEPVETRCVDQVDIPPFSENVVVDETEYVEGDILATGRVTIKGWVKGNVRSLNRRVLVTETGRIDGDVEAPEITIKGSGVILGEQIVRESDDATAPEEVAVSEEGLWVIFAFTLFFLILGFVLLSIIPVRIERFEKCITRYRWRTMLLGIVLTFLLPFLVTIAAITIIGIPIAIALPIVFVFAGAVGVITAGMRISQFLAHRYLPFLRQGMIHLFVGIPVFMVAWLFVALLLGTPDDTSQGFGVALLVLSIIGFSYAIVSGVGAAFLTRLGSREYVTLRDKVLGEPSAPAPAPPPKPEFQPQILAPVPPPPPKTDMPPIS